MISKTSTHNAHNNHHERVPKRKPLSFEPITNSFVPNYFQLLISNPLMTTYRATSANYSDGKLYSIQRIENVPTSASALWIRRWNHILELSKAASPGVLNYFACHMEKNVNAEISTVYLVSEYAANTLKEAKDRLNLSLADAIRAMFQVSETLIDLKKQEHFHHCINPDSIFVIENQDRTYSYKLGNLGAWMKTHEVDYDKRPEYSHFLPQDFDPQNKASKSDVYSLGITIMEIIGVNIDTLMGHKTKEVDPAYQHDTSSLAGTLRKLLLEAVHPDPEKRLSLESLHCQLSSIIAQTKNGDLDYDTCRAELEAVPVVPYNKHAGGLRQKNHLPGSNVVNHEVNLLTENALIVNRPAEIKLEDSDSISQEIEKSERSQEYRNNIVGIEIQPHKPVEEPKTAQTQKRVKTERKSECECDCNVNYKSIITLFFGIFMIVAMLFHYAMPIAIMVIHFGPGVVSSGDVAGGALGIYRNLGVAPISDIAFGSACPSGYEMVNLGTWPGTKSFCYDGQEIETNYNSSECWNEYLSVDSQEYTIWRNSPICVKRIEQISNSSTCPPGYVKCYIGVCAKGTDCGITEIYLETTARTDPGWFSTQYNSSTYVNYRKDVGVIPISLFAIVHGQPTPCLNPYEYGIQNNYAAIESFANGCGRYGDFSGVTQLDNDLSTSIISAQSWGSEPMSLPEFSEQIGRGGQQGYLMAIPRLDINNLSPCLTFNLQTFLDGTETLHSSRKVTTGFSITIIVLLGITTFAWMIGGITNGLKGITVVFGSFMVLTAILTIPAAAVTAKLNGDIATFQEELSSVANSKCFVDTEAQQVFTDFMDTATVANRAALLWKWHTIGCWISVVTLVIARAYFKNQKS